MHSDPPSLPVSFYLHSVPATSPFRKKYFKSWFLWSLCFMGRRHHHIPQLQQGHKPRHGFCSNLGSNRHQQCPCITIGHPNKHGHGKSMALRQHHSLRWLTRPGTFAEPWVVTGVTVTLRVWPLQGHRTKHDLRQKSGLGHLQVPRWQLQPPPLAPVWSLDSNIVSEGQMNAMHPQMPQC